MSKHMIYSNIDLPDVDDELREDYSDIDVSDSDLQYYYLEDWLDAERENLRRNVGTIVVIADLGLWYGRRNGFKVLKSTNLADVLQGYDDYMEWYVEDGELKGTGIHHDGTNYYTYRLLDDDADQEDIDDILNENASSEQVWNATKPLGAEVAEIYGW